MKENKFLDAVGNVDDDVVERFVSMDNELQKKADSSKSKVGWLRIGAMAACFILIVGAVITVPRLNNTDEPGIPPNHTVLNNDTSTYLPPDDTTLGDVTDVNLPPKDTTVDSTADTTLPPETTVADSSTDTTSPPETTASPEDTTAADTPNDWQNDVRYLSWEDVSSFFGSKSNTQLPVDMPYKEAFCEIKSGKYASYEEGSDNVSVEHIGNKIDSIVVRTGWRYSYTGEESDTYEVNADVYEIDGISTDIAVAVKYLEKPVGNGTEYYNMYLNPRCSADSIYDFFEMYNAEAYLTLGSRVYIFPNGESSNSLNYEIYDEAIDDIKNLILNLTSTACYNKYTEDNIKAIENIAGGYTQKLQISIILGNGGVMSVLDNGYVYFVNINEPFALYEIGVDAARNLFDSVKNNAKLLNDPNSFSDETTSVSKY